MSSEQWEVLDNRFVKVAFASRLNHEVEGNAQAQGNDTKQIVAIMESKRNDRVHMPGTFRKNRRNHSTLAALRKLTTKTEAIKLRDFFRRKEIARFVGVLPGDFGGAAVVFFWGAVGEVVGAREVVVGERLEVENVVIGIELAGVARGFVERIANEEVGT